MRNAARSMGRIVIATPIAYVVLCLLLVAQGERAQNPSNPGNTGTPTAQNSAQGQNGGMQAMTDGDGQMSVAEAARLARANKKDGAPPSKAVKKYDDDNFQRSVPLPKRGAQATPDGAGAKSSGTRTGGGQSASLDDYRGKVVLLDFWATWCGVCREALPKVRQLQTVYGDSDFVLVSVSEDEDPNAWRSFVASRGMSWAQRFDGDGSLAQRFQVNALPTYVLLGRDGQEVQRWEGDDPAESIVQRVGPDVRNTLEKKE